MSTIGPALVIALVALGLAACTADAPSKTVDASMPLCTKVIYDRCNTEHDCTSGNCMFFSTTLEVCTMSCSTAVPCPKDTTGAVGTCTPAGVCQPVEANACMVPP